MWKRSGYWQPQDAFGFAVCRRHGCHARRGASRIPGPLLVLKKNEPVEIVAHEPSGGVDGHSLAWDRAREPLRRRARLQRYVREHDAGDGTRRVDHSSGSRRREPARSSTTRTRTTIISSRLGLYGAIVVLDDGETFDEQPRSRARSWACRWRKTRSSTPGSRL